MALFQQSVITKHIESLDKKLIEQKWTDFSAHFGNSTIQNQIRSLKEEQYQGEFLEDLFVKILGYTKAPQPNYNLITEQKNETNSKKADGAILIDGKVKAVIELKGTDTTYLGKIETQAFGYKNNQTECVYVITSNFEKLRFYIDNAVDFIEFNLFTLTKEEFQMFYICLSYENIKNNIPKHLKDESVSKENQISKKLYKDYSEFKRALYNNLVERNPQIDKLLLFKKTQKLLDRFLFIFFAEDRQLVPTNLIRRINLEWENLKKMRIPVSLYDRYKTYFEDLNKGATVTLPAFGKKTGDAITAEFEIFAYNGGLFLSDEILDNVQIDDDILHKHSIILSDYDFESDVDVNILGHIFENSLNEIDEIKSEIAGSEVDKTKTKRKKDGVFYTPKYITKYIVDNTIGKLCEEKKAEFEIIDDEFAKGRKNRNKTTIQKLDKALRDYRDWLLQITICDPACGSGAFLNQALEFLIQEHKYIDNLEAQLLGSSIGFPGAELHILENNIYGVDLNDESVEIAKLSLWLRTAQKGRKLNSLNNNIKCGNSLIDDVAIAGDKAFSWEKEFPEVFERGGFDVIIGNPPYVKLETIKETSTALEKLNYQTFDKRGDLYVLFVEKGFQIAKEKGFISYIMPNKWLQAGYGEKLRSFLINREILELIDFGDIQIFEGATTYPFIFNARNNSSAKTFIASALKKELMSDFVQNVIFNSNEFKTSEFSNETWVISSGSDNKLLTRLQKKFQSLKNLINGEANYGIKPGLSEAFIIPEEIYNKIIKSDQKSKEILRPLLRGRDISPWYASYDNFYLVCTFPALKIDIENYKGVKEHLLSFGIERLEQSGKPNSRKKTANKWFETQDTIGYFKDFEKPKIMYQKFQVKPCFIYDESGLYCNDSMWIIPTENKALLGVLNSKMGWWLITKYCTQIQNGCQLIWKYFSQIPIPKTTTQLGALVETMLNLNKEFQKLSQKFSTYFSKQYKIEKLSGKLEKWYELEFTDFVKELNKCIKLVGGTPLTKKDEFEWMELFEENKKKAFDLKAEIDKTDKEIDQMVYDLYGLTEEEIKIVEGV